MNIQKKRKKRIMWKNGGVGVLVIIAIEVQKVLNQKDIRNGQLSFKRITA